MRSSGGVAARDDGIGLGDGGDNVRQAVEVQASRRNCTSWLVRSARMYDRTPLAVGGSFANLEFETTAWLGM
jgi:hypothetical protein